MKRSELKEMINEEYNSLIESTSIRTKNFNKDGVIISLNTKGASENDKKNINKIITSIKNIYPDVKKITIEV